MVSTTFLALTLVLSFIFYQSLLEPELCSMFEIPAPDLISYSINLLGNEGILGRQEIFLIFYIFNIE